MHPVLYSYRRCPFAMRARMTLWAAQIQCEVRDISLQNKPDLFLQTSPKGTVPVLVLTDGTVIDESLDIMAWALMQNDPYGWYDPQDKAVIESFMNDFVPSVYRYKYPDRYDDAEVALQVAYGWQWLADNGERIKDMTAFDMYALRWFDIAIMPFVRQWFHVAMQHGTQVDNPWSLWAKHFETLPCFTAIMMDYPRWSNDCNQAPYWLLPL